MEWNRATTALFGGSVIQLDMLRDTTVRIEQHWPGQLGDLAGSQPGFEGEQDHHTVTLRVPAVADSPQRGKDLLWGEYLGLFAWHGSALQLSTLRPASRS